MTDLTAAQLLDLVNSSRIADGHPRTRDIVQRIVADLFRTIGEFNVTPQEFWLAADWLNRLGTNSQTGLVTAGLGFDRLLDILADDADRRAGNATGTPRAIEGPLHVEGAPLRQKEARLDDGETTGEVLVMEGNVVDTDSRPVAHAVIDVWHANGRGRYSHFDPDQPAFHLRRRIETDEHGAYRFRTVLPPGYAIPATGPTAELFAALGRHGNRPAHIHFMVSGPGVRALTTQVNIAGDPYLHDDFAFATRDGLIVELQRDVPPQGYQSLGIATPFTRVRFDFVLQPSQGAREDCPHSAPARATAPSKPTSEAPR